MLNEKDLMNTIRRTYQQQPREEFVYSTEKILRQKARSMDKRIQVKRLSAVWSGVFLFAVAFSWIFLFSGKDVLINALYNLNEGASSSVINSTKKEPLVFIYHTHNQESFTPELNESSSENAFSESKNITLVGKKLSEALNEKNINAIYDDTDIASVLNERDLMFADSYLISREILQNTLNEHESIKMVIDLHRDSQKREATTVKINGKDYARILFAVSSISEHYDINNEFAIELNSKLEELYPGITRGIYLPGESARNNYNQDLHPNSVLVEIGGIENSLEETYRSAEIFAEVVKQVMEDLE